MKFNFYTTILTTLGALPVALGQQVPAGLPACAQTCAISAIGSSGCASTDIRCVCASSSFITQFDACVAAACSPSDAAVSRQSGGQFCSSAGVPGATSASASSTHPVTSTPASAPPVPHSSSRPAIPSSQPEFKSETETQVPAHPSSTAPPEVEQTSQFHSSVPAASVAPSSALPQSVGPVAPIETASATAPVSRPQPVFTGAAVRMQAPGLLMGLGGFLAVVL